MNTTRPWRQIAVIALTGLVLTACGDKDTAAAAPGQAAQPIQVGVVTVQPKPVSLVQELPGRLEASRTAEVRARAAGIVQKRAFEEGSEVKAGAVLYRIDPAPLKAELSSAQAQLARARANLKQAGAKAERYEPLVATNAISRQDYDDAVAARDLAVADIAAAKAAVDTAELRLGYATVTAPIGGRIGRALVTEGALVGQGEATPLATIQQIDPLYVNLTQSSTELLRLRRTLASDQKDDAGEAEAKVTLITEDGQEYPHPGKLLFSDISVDPSTGAVRVRAAVPNPDRFLLPGMYVRARVEQAATNEAITVPQQAVNRSAQGSSVMVIGADGTVQPRPVQVGRAYGDAWVISAGLKAGEQVIVDGLQKVRPGAPVTPVPWNNPLAGEPAVAAVEQTAPAPQAN